MKALRWILVLPGALLITFVLDFPLHWLVMMIQGEDSGNPLKLIEADTLERLGYALIHPIVVIYSGSWIAPSHKRFTSRMMGVIYLLTAVIFGVTAEVNPFPILLGLLGIGIGLYLVEQKLKDDWKHSEEDDNPLSEKEEDPDMLSVRFRAEARLAMYVAMAQLRPAQRSQEEMASEREGIVRRIKALQAGEEIEPDPGGEQRVDPDEFMEEHIDEIAEFMKKLHECPDNPDLREIVDEFVMVCAELVLVQVDQESERQEWKREATDLLPRFREAIATLPEDHPDRIAVTAEAEALHKRRADLIERGILQTPEDEEEDEEEEEEAEEEDEFLLNLRLRAEARVILYEEVKKYRGEVRSPDELVAEREALAEQYEAIRSGKTYRLDYATEKDLDKHIDMACSQAAEALRSLREFPDNMAIQDSVAEQIHLMAQRISNKLDVDRMIAGLGKEEG